MNYEGTCMEMVYETCCTIYWNLLESNDGGLMVTTVFNLEIVLVVPNMDRVMREPGWKQYMKLVVLSIESYWSLTTVV
jgi:hypothetical protein